MLITSSVSFTYSSSEAASAGERAGAVRNRVTADRERKLRRHATPEAAEEEVGRLAAATVLDRVGVKGFEVVVAAAAVGVIREAMMGWCVEREREVRFVREKK